MIQVKFGQPFHIHTLFTQLEMCLLTHSFRVEDPVTLEIQKQMRWRQVTLEDATTVAELSAATYQPRKAATYARDWEITHVVTTNREVDEINQRYIVDFARDKLEKVFMFQPGSGPPLAFAKGARYVIPATVHVASGLANGTTVKGQGVLFDDYSTDCVREGQAVCALVIVDDPLVNTKWAEEVYELLMANRDKALLANGSSMTDSDIAMLRTALHRIVPLSHVSQMKDVDSEGTRRLWTATIPLRLARAVTVYKVQGESLGRMIFTLGDKRMTGTSYTAFTRPRGGLADILLAGQWDTNKFLDNFNTGPHADFDMVLVDAKLASMQAITQGRAQAGILYTGDVQHQNEVVGAASASFRGQQAQ